MFRPVDLSRPFDIGTHPMTVASTATIKGLYPQQIVDWQKSKGRRSDKNSLPPGAPSRNYIQFKDYPQREYASLVCAAIAADGREPRVVMHEITADSFSLLRNTMLVATSLAETSNTITEQITCEASEWFGDCFWQLRREPGGYDHGLARVMDDNGVEQEVQQSCSSAAVPQFTGTNGWS